MCYLNCIRILLQHGASPNCSYRSNLTPLHVLIFTVSENFTLNCDIQKQTNFDFIKNILILLLQHGLDCNITSQHILQSVLEMLQNVRMQSVALDMACVYELSLVLLQYGADPSICLSNRIATGNNVLALNDFLLEFDRGRSGHRTAAVSAVDTVSGAGPSTNGNDSLRNSFRNNAKNYLLFYFIMLIMRKEFILLDPEQTYTRIIYLFYLSMKHEPLYNCLRSLHNLFIVQVPNRSIENLSTIISTLYKKPRTLKQICRVCIYEHFNRKLAQNINQLHLPPPLKDYMLNFDL